MRALAQPATSVLGTSSPVAASKTSPFRRRRPRRAHRDQFYCVFQVANRYTFGFLFGVDFTEISACAPAPQSVTSS